MDETTQASILETQYEFISSTAKKTLYLGGVGCVHPGTKIEVEGFSPERFDPVEISSVDSFSQWHNLKYKSFNGVAFDSRYGSLPFKKGVGEMFRVVSEEGEIIVYEKHEFLCSDLHYRYPTAFLETDLIGLFSTKESNLPFYLYEDIYLLFDRVFKFIEYFMLKSQPFRSVAYLFTGRFFDPKYEQVVKLLQAMVKTIQDNVEVFSVRITKFDSVSHPLQPTQLVHFYNEFCYELAKLAHDLLPNYLKGQKNKKEILKKIKYLKGVWHSHDFRFHPNNLSRNKVLAVEKFGTSEYWDLQVPDTHNYVAHGMVHHNSGKTYSGGDLALHMATNYPRTKGLLTANTHQQLVNSTVQALSERWDELGLMNGVDYKVVASGSKKRINLLGQEILLYSLNADIPAKGITVGWWLGDESAFVKKKQSTPVGHV